MSEKQPTNVAVAARLDLTGSTVSRIRSGTRLPSLDAMVKIGAVYGWTLDDQAKAKEAGQYAEMFEKHLADKHLADSPPGY